jgi:hypothetical protein
MLTYTTMVAAPQCPRTSTRSKKSRTGVTVRSDSAALARPRFAGWRTWNATQSAAHSLQRSFANTSTSPQLEPVSSVRPFTPSAGERRDVGRAAHPPPQRPRACHVPSDTATSRPRSTKKMPGAYSPRTTTYSPARRGGVLEAARYDGSSEREQQLTGQCHDACETRDDRVPDVAHISNDRGCIYKDFARRPHNEQETNKVRIVSMTFNERECVKGAGVRHNGHPKHSFMPPRNSLQCRSAHAQHPVVIEEFPERCEHNLPRHS